MSKSDMNRRDFMKTSAAATVAASTAATVTTTMNTKQTWAADGLDHRNERTDRMNYRKLGRTNFMGSTLTFGCGAALMGGKATRLLERAYDQGVNHFDVGTTQYYKGSEKEMRPFLKRHGDDVWVTSKGFARQAQGINDDLTYNVETAKADAKFWTTLLEQSLSELDQEHVDAYYLMGIGNPIAVANDELHSAFVAAKAAGKVDHFGISTHKRASACLKAAIECGWHSCAMIAITPGGWYDWDTKSLLEGTANLKTVQAELKAASDAGIGLVGMKAGRFIAPGTSLGKGDETAFDKYYPEAFTKSGLNAFQRSYAFVLEHGLHTVNADMQNFKAFEENVIAARDSEKYTDMIMA